MRIRYGHPLMIRPRCVFMAKGNGTARSRDDPERRAALGEDFSDYLVWASENGKRRVFSTSARATMDGGSFDGAVVTFTDVTSLVKALAAKDLFFPTLPRNCGPR